MNKLEIQENFVAIGTFLPAIEIWNLDVIDTMEPTCILGGEVPETNYPTMGNQPAKQIFIEGSHTDAIMDLSWNTNQRNLLASASADHYAKNMGFINTIMYSNIVTSQR